MAALLAHRAQSCVLRPLRRTQHDGRPYADQVMARQAAYLAAMASVPNLTIVPAIPAFCDQNRCIVTNIGDFHYADDDHLSVAGSLFQARRWIAPVLAKP